MNTSNLKRYAPQARRDFKEAVSRRLNALGINVDSKGQIVTIEPQISGSIMQIGNNNFDVKINGARNRLINACNKSGFDAFVEHVAYTWFNRLCAIRYMELHDYLDHGFRVLSHPNNPTSFEILDHAQDVAEALGLDRSQLIELKLAGNKDEELYRELLLGQCHALHVAMPFLFEALDDEAELLLPDNLTRTDSLIRGLIDEVPEEDWEQVEVIGWLYQFYISEKKDQVIGKVVKSEDIPAATQLFTPNWIVKYLVQNSVGRHWLQTYPDSGIKGQMEYYIEPAEQTPEVIEQLKAITPESIEPESIKVLDPACGSGHILIEAYNVLKAIYEERGYRSRDIPKLILENNLFGLDIDDRAAQLAGFALMMMARNDDKRIFTRNVRLHVLSLQESNDIDLPALWRALNLSGSWQQGNMPDLFADEQQDLSSFNADNRYQLLKRTLERFTQAKTFGSLLEIPTDEYEELNELFVTLVDIEENGDVIQKVASKNLLPFLHQAWILTKQYDSVIANPPYMGSKYQIPELKKDLKVRFSGYEKDLFSVFIIRNLQFAKPHAQLGFMTPFVWMFISSYEQLRQKLIDNEIISTLVQLEYSGFDGATVPICTFTLRKCHIDGYIGSYIKLSDFKGATNQGPMTLYAIKNRNCGWFFNACADNFKMIPSIPLAYWISEKLKNTFLNPMVSNYSIEESSQCLTGDNNRFLRYVWEINTTNIGRNKKWLFYAKGGGYRKWYGNLDNVINWSDEAINHYRTAKVPRIIPEYLWYKEGITWGFITSSLPSFRFLPESAVFDVGGSSIFFKDHENLNFFLGFFNTQIAIKLVGVFNQTLNYQLKDIRNMPVCNTSETHKKLITDLVDKCRDVSKRDWDSFETSFDFSQNPLVRISNFKSIKKCYEQIRAQWENDTSKLAELEHKINSIFIEIYNLQNEVDISTNWRYVSLNRNPRYRFPSISDDSECEVVLQSETIAELLSFSIGCIMGRYSLDKEGIIYAHSCNEYFSNLVNEYVFSKFPADEDGIIPLTDQEWFKDDATNRFREFVKVVWGEEHLQENLDFVAESLCLNAIKPKKSEPAMETIRRYLSTQFYKDHLKTYKKRPIYWLFSSGKQKAFECLVYLHRYNEGTLSRMRTEYVTPLLGKYDAYIDQLKQQVENADSTAEANRLKKEQDALIKKQIELREFDDKLKHYADMRISLDLDDGVKVNYGKFGDLLSDVKAITGSDSGAE